MCFTFIDSFHFTKYQDQYEIQRSLTIPTWYIPWKTQYEILTCLQKKKNKLKNYDLQPLRVGHSLSHHSQYVRFLSLCITDIFGQIILCFGSCPAGCRIFSSILGLSPPEASSIICPKCDIQKCLQTLPDIPWV